ncbi:transposase [Nocardia rhamnosiphila]
MDFRFSLQDPGQPFRSADRDAAGRARSLRGPHQSRKRHTGIRNLPVKSFAANQVWLALVALDLTAWMQIPALTHHQARRWEPKTSRLHLLSLPGHIARHTQRTRLPLPRSAPQPYWPSPSRPAWKTPEQQKLTPTTPKEHHRPGSHPDDTGRPHQPTRIASKTTKSGADQANPSASKRSRLHARRPPSLILPTQ